MTNNQRDHTFIFENYHLNYTTGILKMHFSHMTTFEDSDEVERKHYTETVTFEIPENRDAINTDVVDALCFYSFVIAGTSYYKLYPQARFVFRNHTIDYWQADFFSMIYSGGLSQFVYENNLTAESISEFESNGIASHHVQDYDGEGLVLMNSGGKDSLTSAELLKKHKRNFISWHMSTTGTYPPVLDQVGVPAVVSRRQIDLEAIKRDLADGGLNGHIPFSALFAGYGLVQAALQGREFLIASNESSADEANIEIDGYKINHQFSKTFPVELAISEYLRRYVSEEIHYGSILRPLNELDVAKLFAKTAWKKYKNDFSSCNLANYKQGQDGKALTWDGTCAKCANFFVLLAPFVEKDDLLTLFDGKNLLTSPDMNQHYKDLFGLSEVKPFECVGTIEEMREAYRMAVEKDPEYHNPEFTVDQQRPEFTMGPYQDIFDELVDYSKLI